MEAFNPAKDFYDRRSKLRYEMTVLLPEVGMTPFPMKPYPEHFANPAPSFIAFLRWQDKLVGQASFGFNPLGDRIYLYRLFIKPQYQRQHLGLATLWHLHLQYRLPIVPMGEGHPFWQVARKVLGRTGASIFPELCGQQLEQEALRWQSALQDTQQGLEPAAHLPSPIRPWKL